MPAKILLFVTLFIMAFLVEGQGLCETLESIQNASKRLIAIKRETVKLESDWLWQKELLGSTNAALTVRKGILESEIALMKAENLKESLKYTESSGLRDTASAQLAELEELVATLTGSLVELRHCLPPRLSRALELPYQSLSDPKLDTNERLKGAVTIFSRSFRFNHSIVISEELIDVGAGDQMMEVLYWGLSHGYALDRQNGKAFFGAPDETGWHWKAEDSLVTTTEQLIAVYKGEMDPDFVESPVRIFKWEKGE